MTADRNRKYGCHGIKNISGVRLKTASHNLHRLLVAKILELLRTIASRIKAVDRHAIIRSELSENPVPGKPAGVSLLSLLHCHAGIMTRCRCLRPASCQIGPSVKVADDARAPTFPQRDVHGAQIEHLNQKRKQQGRPHNGAERGIRCANDAADNQIKWQARTAVLRRGRC